MHTSPSSHAVIDRWLLQALIAGASAAVLLPFAQVDTPAFGWLPMWLIGLPLAAWLGWRWLSRVGGMPMSVAATARNRRRIAYSSLRGRRSTRVMAMATRRPNARA
ncbi:MAG: hypothetical protein IAE66_02350 [Xanthomonadaceae bacterium]|nr:hypothetical protein [Xanthomonadaceae bacterium]